MIIEFCCSKKTDYKKIKHDTLFLRTAAVVVKTIP